MKTEQLYILTYLLEFMSNIFQKAIKNIAKKPLLGIYISAVSWDSRVQGLAGPGRTRES